MIQGVSVAWLVWRRLGWLSEAKAEAAAAGRGGNGDSRCVTPWRLPCIACRLKC